MQCVRGLGEYPSGNCEECEESPLMQSRPKPLIDATITNQNVEGTLTSPRCTLDNDVFRVQCRNTNGGGLHL